MVKFNKEGIELIRNKINSDELKTIGRLTENSFIRERKIDLNSFRNSFSFLEYVCTNEFTLSEIVQISCHYCHKYFNNELSSNLNEIAVNTEILFNSPNKTLKKVRR